MHFALLNGNRVEPSKGLDGAVCPFCKQPVRARCGEVRRKHWAHKSVIDCDPWKEPETTWHRVWKDCFGGLQEQIHEKDGVRHMADVKTSDGTIVEFRHRNINGEGCRTREAFFGESMFWVVDCTVDQHKQRFNDNLGLAAKVDVPCNEGEFFTIDAPELCFPRNWVECKRFVFFDFGEQLLWCLFPRNETSRWAVFWGVSKDNFVVMVKDGYAKFRERCVGIWRQVKQVNNLRQDLQIQNRSCFERRVRLTQLQQAESRTAPVDIDWPATFDRTVSLALTVDAVHAWLIARGQLKTVVTGSQINGEADATGCCVIHCSDSFGHIQLYWAKRRLHGELSDEIINQVPESNELEKLVGSFIGVAEYHVEELPSNQIKVYLRNFKSFEYCLVRQRSSECMWRLDDTLQSQLESLLSGTRT